MIEPLSDKTARELIWAVQALTDAIRDYARIKERGIRLAQTIEDDRSRRVYVYE